VHWLQQYDIMIIILNIQYIVETTDDDIDTHNVSKRKIAWELLKKKQYNNTVYIARRPRNE